MTKKYIMLYEGNNLSCNRLINELKSYNIYPIVRDKSRSALLAGFGFNFNEKTTVFVRSDQMIESKDIIYKLGI